MAWNGKLIDLTSIDGKPIALVPSVIAIVQEFPTGQCQITLQGGALLQVTEDTADVRRWWLEGLAANQEQG
jgi:uncharacterized protein YlzI (FlbEa/FlbD family)